MSEAADAYAHSPVPESETTSGWRVGLIVASFSIGLPDFLNGAHVALALGLPLAVLTAFLAGLLLCIGSSMTSVVSVRTRLSTYLLTQRSFGRQGAGLINTVIALIHFCWFGVNASFFGEALVEAARANGLPASFAGFVVLGAAIMAVATILGFRALDRLAMLTVPLLVVILGTVATIALQRHGLVVAPARTPPEPMRFGIALSALAGAYMIALATMPDLARYVRTTRGAIGVMALSFPLTLPVMMTASALPALATGETSLMKLVTRFDLGTPVLFLLLLPTVTLNALNLYSASLSLGTTFPRVPRAAFVVLGTVTGTAFALMGIVEAFIPFVLFLSLIIPPIAAIYVIDSLTIFRRADPSASIRHLPVVRWPAVATWVGSVVIASLAAYRGWTITSVPALDATLFAGVVYGLLQRRRLIPRAA